KGRGYCFAAPPLLTYIETSKNYRSGYFQHDHYTSILNKITHYYPTHRYSDDLGPSSSLSLNSQLDLRQKCLPSVQLLPDLLLHSYSRALSMLCLLIDFYMVNFLYYR